MLVLQQSTFLHNGSKFLSSGGLLKQNTLQVATSCFSRFKSTLRPIYAHQPHNRHRANIRIQNLSHSLIRVSDIVSRCIFVIIIPIQRSSALHVIRVVEIGRLSAQSSSRWLRRIIQGRASIHFIVRGHRVFVDVRPSSHCQLQRHTR
jgi:hypothetical protein